MLFRSRVAAQRLSSYELDSHLDAAVALPAHLDLAKLTLTKRLTEDVVSKLGSLRVFRLGVVLSALGSDCSSATAAIVDTLAADQTESCDGSKICARGHGRAVALACLCAGDVILGVGDDDAVYDGALLARQAGSYRRLANGRG